MPPPCSLARGGPVLRSSVSYVRAMVGANRDLLHGDTAPPRAAAAPDPGQAIGTGLGKHPLNQVE